tara:strand:- start:838 stop:1110 length:273 start_codon:yes stop_codon:yes gene_type:complete
MYMGLELPRQAQPADDCSPLSFVVRTPGVVPRFDIADVPWVCCVLNPSINQRALDQPSTVERNIQFILAEPLRLLMLEDSMAGAIQIPID